MNRAYTRISYMLILPYLIFLSTNIDINLTYMLLPRHFCVALATKTESKSARIPGSRFLLYRMQFPIKKKNVAAINCYA